MEEGSVKKPTLKEIRTSKLRGENSFKYNKSKENKDSSSPIKSSSPLKSSLKSPAKSVARIASKSILNTTSQVSPKGSPKQLHAREIKEVFQK